METLFVYALGGVLAFLLVVDGGMFCGADLVTIVATILWAMVITRVAEIAYRCDKRGNWWSYWP